MLSDFCCSMTCLKWLRFLNEPLKKKIVRCSYYLEAFIWFSALMLYLGWLGTCLQHILLLQSHHKPLWSFSFWLVKPFYASFNDVLSLCMIMAVIALLVGHSQSFASSHFVLSMSSTRASNSQKPSIPMCPPYIPISNLLFQSTFDLLLSIFQIKLFLVLCEN
jgi:hypothetical protein